MKKILMALIILINGFVNANADSLVLMAGSYHILHDKTSEVSNNTQGIGYEAKYFGGMIYNNSFGDTSAIVYGKYDFNRYLSQSVGIASGYEETKIIPMTSFKYKNYRIATSYPFAELAGGLTDVVSFQYVFDF